jgi:uncharacterized SAM-binding protein YcdF (DUF218 family)
MPRLGAIDLAGIVLLGAIGAIGLAAAAVSNQEAILQTIGDSLVVQDDLHPADVIHVISGPDHRTDFGIQLFLQGYGVRILFTGGPCPEIQGDHAERARTRALAQGVPDPAIVMDGVRVTSTYSEVLRLQELIATRLTSQDPITSVIVVSDPHHMRRARWTYRHVLGDSVEVQMAPVPFEQGPYQRRWWTDELSRMMVKDEYIKLPYYWARYQLNWKPLTQWLASLDQE